MAIQITDSLIMGLAENLGKPIEMREGAVRIVGLGIYVWRCSSCDLGFKTVESAQRHCYKRKEAITNGML